MRLNDTKQGAQLTANVFIDGVVGTTGLVIFDMLSGRTDVEVICLDESQRKSDTARREALSDADLAILCLPDEPARQAAQWASNSDTKVIDASTAHRTHRDWVYGMPELNAETREAIRSAKRTANPGCYPTAVILMLRPLIDAQVISADAPLAIHALSGYSGGGKKMIERWEDADGELARLPYSAPYALWSSHKHISEMMKYCALSSEPQFLPRVGNFPQGMRVEIPLNASLLKRTDTDMRQFSAELLGRRYRDEKFVSVRQWSVTDTSVETSFDPTVCNRTNSIEIHICPHRSGHITLIGILDNLGKGAGGAAVQSMNLMLGFDEGEGLSVR